MRGESPATCHLGIAAVAALSRLLLPRALPRAPWILAKRSLGSDLTLSHLPGRRVSPSPFWAAASGSNRGYESLHCVLNRESFLDVQRDLQGEEQIRRANRKVGWRGGGESWDWQEVHFGGEGKCELKGEGLCLKFGGGPKRKHLECMFLVPVLNKKSLMFISLERLVFNPSNRTP